MGQWRFLLDENIDPKTATYLGKEGLHVEHVRDALWQGADDVLPYARERDLVVVTSDVQDFGNLEPESHAGVVVLYDDAMPAYLVAAGLLTMIDAYPNRGAGGARFVGVTGTAAARTCRDSRTRLRLATTALASRRQNPNSPSPAPP